MIIAFIGVILIIFSLVRDDGTVNWIMIAIGAFLVVCGILAIDVHTEEVRAKENRRRYWAYGERPDWDREKRSK